MLLHFTVLKILTRWIWNKSQFKKSNIANSPNTILCIEATPIIGYTTQLQIFEIYWKNFEKLFAVFLPVCYGFFVFVQNQNSEENQAVPNQANHDKSDHDWSKYWIGFIL